MRALSGRLRIGSGSLLFIRCEVCKEEWKLGCNAGVAPSTFIDILGVNLLKVEEHECAPVDEEPKTERRLVLLP